MIQKGMTLLLAMVWIAAIITGCVPGRENSSLPPTSAPSSQAPMTPLPTLSTPSPSVTPPTVTEAKPTPPGGEQPLVLPPPATLPPLTAPGQVRDLTEIGIRLQVPAEWETLRIPGGYIFAAAGEYRVVVSSCCEELPRALPELQEALGPYWHTLREEDVVVVPIEGPQWEGVGVWHRSNPEVCLTVYIPSPEITRQITFFPYFVGRTKSSWSHWGDRFWIRWRSFRPKEGDKPGLLQFSGAGRLALPQDLTEISHRICYDYFVGRGTLPTRQRRPKEPQPREHR